MSFVIATESEANMTDSMQRLDRRIRRHFPGINAHHKTPHDLEHASKCGIESIWAQHCLHMIALPAADDYTHGFVAGVCDAFGWPE